MPKFYMITARKKFFPKFWGHVPPPTPPSPTPMNQLVWHWTLNTMRQADWDQAFDLGNTENHAAYLTGYQHWSINLDRVNATVPWLAASMPDEWLRGMAKYITGRTSLTGANKKVMDYGLCFAFALHFFLLSTFDTRYGLLSHIWSIYT